MKLFILEQLQVKNLYLNLLIQDIPNEQTTCVDNANFRSHYKIDLLKGNVLIYILHKNASLCTHPTDQTEIKNIENI